MIESEHTDETAPPVQSVNRPTPGASLIASARRITSKTLKGSGDGQKRNTAQAWQEDAWDMYDLVGEQRFLSSTLAGRLSQARLFVGKLPDDPTEPPEPVDDGPAADAFAAFGHGSQGQIAQLIARLGVNLFVAGDGWLVGIPDDLLPASEQGAQPPERPAPGQPAPPQIDDGDGQPREITPLIPGTGNIDLSELDWRMLSVTEVQFGRDDDVTLQLGDGKGEQITCSVDEVFLIRVWRPHPRRSWQADSPTRASLPVLRELVGLTMHVSAQVDSRLAGAGVFLVPQSASEAIRRQAGQDNDDDDDPFTESLIEAMITPINDRSNASAYVPLVVTVPDETTEKFQHISFASPLDAEARELRDEAIRRLALGQDAPPEILLGTGGMNHWGAWLVREDTISTHIEPPLALICDALTSQFLQPILIDGGMSEDTAGQYVVWYDVDHLIMRPNRTQDAQNLHAAGVLSDKAYRDAAGFGDQDAPATAESVDPAVSAALDMVKAAPTLAQEPGLLQLVEQVRAVMNGTPLDESQTPAPAPPDEPTADTPADGGPPDGSDVDAGTEDGGPPPSESEEIAASAGPLIGGEPIVPVETPPPDGRPRPRTLTVSHGG